ncbi:MAG TPA: hypothetical protein VMC80_03390, partial [Patescibacteria group bacterium]|nr:hypothetical protein [Patescibacteria group bacterium]
MDELYERLKTLDEAIHHYEMIAWNVTALFVAAITLLISLQKIPSFFIYLLGLSITISAVLFNISFRRRQHFYICAKKKMLKEIKKQKRGNLDYCEKLELIINNCFDNAKVNQWYAYLALFLFITSYWVYRLLWYINISYITLINETNIFVRIII